MKLEQNLKRIKNTIIKYQTNELDNTIASELHDLVEYLDMIIDNIYEIKNNTEEYLIRKNKKNMINNIYAPCVLSSLILCDKIDNSHFIDSQINKEFIKKLLEKYLEY